MTTTSQIPLAVLALIKTAAGLPSALESIERKEKTIENDIEAALGRNDGVVFVMPVKPLQVTEGADFIFFEKAEVRVRMIVNPTLTSIEMESGEIAAQIRLALQGTNPGGLLEENMRLANPPVEEVEDPECIIKDLIFHASYQESA